MITFIVRRRAWVALGWLGISALLVPAAPRLEESLDVSARIVGSESAGVEETLARRFASPFAHNALLVVGGVPSPERPEGRAALERVVSGLRVTPGVLRTLSRLDLDNPYFVGGGGEGTFIVVGLDAEGGRVDRLVPGLRSSTHGVLPSLRAAFPGATLRWTGEAAINFDLWRTVTLDAHAAERRTLPFVLGLLFLAFGTVTSALLPLIAGVLAVALVLGIVSLFHGTWAPSILIVNVVSMLGLALGIDYALLMVSRFRDCLASGQEPEGAAIDAACLAGRTVALSGAAVSIGFAALLLVPLNELRSVAVGGLLVGAVSVLLASTLLPGILRSLGPWIDRGRLGLLGRGERRERWRFWARGVSRHPWAVLGVTLPPLLLLAAQSVRLNAHIPGGDWLPARVESSLALADLKAMGRGGAVHTLRVVLELPEGVPALSLEGWAALHRLAQAFSRDSRVARVEWLGSVAGGEPQDLAAVALLPTYVKRTFVSEEGDAALLDVVPREDVDAGRLSGLVREIRRAGPSSWTGLQGGHLRVGGLPAFYTDYEDSMEGRLGGVVALVVSTTFLALLVGFRSALIPLKAIALNLLSVAASFGAVVLVFQEGHGAKWLGLAGPVDGIFPFVPTLVFCVVFGLSMDYEVFLVARVAEARRAGREDAEALAEGVACTARVITSAAAIMITVFASFALGEFLVVKMLGFALSVAVFLDATVIRLALGPALLRLAGRWNWWPGMH